MTEQAHTRDIPAPRYEIVSEQANEVEGESHHEWLIKTVNKHPVKLLPGSADKHVMFGDTSYVSVTTTAKTFPNGKTFNQTAVYASDADGTFYNAPVYVSPGVLELWQVMYAIGEV